MAKIAVIGTSGCGKSTVSAELGRRLGVPYIELDALHHGPNWSEPSAEEFRARVEQAMLSSPQGWVIDGNYERKLGRLVIDAAETVVWVDLPLSMLLRRLWRRTSTRIRDRVELWNGNKESWLTAFWGWDSLFAWTVRAYFRHKREWPQRYASHPGFVRLSSPQQVSAWLEQYAPVERLAEL